MSGIRPLLRTTANTASAAHQLSDSLPQLVKKISSGSAPTMAATLARAASTAALQGRPKAWALEGLPKAVRKGRISSAASGKMGVVAL